METQNLQTFDQEASGVVAELPGDKSEEFGVKKTKQIKPRILSCLVCPQKPVALVIRNPPQNWKWLDFSIRFLFKPLSV